VGGWGHFGVLVIVSRHDAPKWLLFQEMVCWEGGGEE
jgi:hypothetical protein